MYQGSGIMPVGSTGTTLCTLWGEINILHHLFPVQNPQINNLAQILNFSLHLPLLS